VAGALQVTRTSVYTSSGGDRGDVLDWTIVIVDGPSSDRSSTLREAMMALRDDIRLSLIAVDSRASAGELAAVARMPAADLYVFDYSQLADGFAQRFICTELALKGLPTTTRLASTSLLLFYYPPE